MEALINCARPFSFIDSFVYVPRFIYIQSPVFIYLHFLCLLTFLYLFTFSHRYSYLFSPRLFTRRTVKLTFDLRGETNNDKIFAYDETARSGSRFRNVVESIFSREGRKSGCGSVLIDEESHGFVFAFEEMHVTRGKSGLS